MILDGPSHDWLPGGEFQPDYFKIAASKSVTAEPASGVATTPAKRRIKPQAVLTDDIPEISLPDDVVVIRCIVQSDADPRGCGVPRAVEDRSTKPVCIVFKIGAEHFTWTPNEGYACPAPVLEALTRGSDFLCERIPVDCEMYRKLGWPEPRRWTEIAAILGAANFNRSVDKSCEAVLKIQLDLIARRFFRSLWCRGGMRLSQAEIGEACRVGVRRTKIIAALAAKVGTEISIDRDVYASDITINTAGVCVDVQFIEACIEMEQRLKKEINKYAAAVMARLPGNPKTHKAALQSLSVKISDGKISDLLKALRSTDDDDAKIILQAMLLKQQTSISKFKRILKQVSADGRLRWLYNYQQARTGRWSSENTQVHNLKKTTLDAEQIKALVEAVNSRSIERLLACIPLEQVYEAIVGLIRAVFIPCPGNRFLIADFKAIEARVILWLSGDSKLLNSFVACDAYVVMAEVIFLERIATDHPEFNFRRAVGKVGILGCQFGMGADALRKYCLGFGIDLAAKGIDPQRIVDAYRAGFKSVVNLWYGYQKAIFAVMRTRQDNTFGRVTFRMSGNTLITVLPSGRMMAYHNSRIEDGRFGKVFAYTLYKKSRVEEVQAWGGKIAENICQAVARDALADALPRLHKQGITVSLHTHDEIVAEVPVETIATDEPNVKVLLEQPPAWASDLPLNVSLFPSDRYGEESILR